MVGVDFFAAAGAPQPVSAKNANTAKQIALRLILPILHFIIFTLATKGDQRLLQMESVKPLFLLKIIG
jgi:hypothetical protein